MQIRQRKVPADSGIEMAKMNREAEPPDGRPQAEPGNEREGHLTTATNAAAAIVVRR